LPDALAGPGRIVPAIMPERLALTSPFKPVAEIVGSGPYRFLTDEHISGARAAYERFPVYQPCTAGSVGFTSGPKIAHFDRVEWLTLDQFSAMAALRNGEIDWWELPPTDLVEQLAHTGDVAVISQYATAMGVLRFNHLHPPFDNAAVRQALLGAVDQAEAMTAVAGTDRAFWHDGIGLFPAGTPFANDAGIEVLRGPRDYPAVRQALASAGYNGETVVVVAPTDVQPIHALGLAGTDQLRRAGMALLVSAGNSFAHFVKAVVLMAQWRYEEAIPELETVIAADPNLARAYAALGWCKMMTGLIDEAIPLEERAIRLSPRDLYIGIWYWRIGVVHLLQSRTDEAIVWLEKARVVMPGYALHHAWLAAALAITPRSSRVIRRADLCDRR